MTGHVYQDRYDLGPGDAQLLHLAAPCAEGWCPVGNEVMRARAFAEWWYCATKGSKVPPRVQGQAMARIELDYPRYGWHWYTGSVSEASHVIGLPAAAHVVLAAMWWESGPGRRMGVPARLAAAATLAWSCGDVRRL